MTPSEDNPETTEYAVRSRDELNGEQITRMPTLAMAIDHLKYLQRVSATRSTYFIHAEIVERETANTPWLPLPADEARARMDSAEHNAWRALRFVVSGSAVDVLAPADRLISDELAELVGAPDGEWELRDAVGALVAINHPVSTLQPYPQRYFLDRRAGWGG